MIPKTTNELMIQGWTPLPDGSWEKPRIVVGRVVLEPTPNRLPSPSEAVAKEAKLHNQILDECKKRGWICFHGSMAHRTFRTEGEPDFVILADKGRTFFIEAKRATKASKLSPAQRALAHWAKRLGHAIHVVRNVKEFLEIVKPA